MCPGHVPGSRSESVTERSTTRAEVNDSRSTLLLSVGGAQRLPKPLLGLGYRVPAYPFEQSLQDGFLGFLRLLPLPVEPPRADALFKSLAQKGLDAAPVELFEARGMVVCAGAGVQPELPEEAHLRDTFHDLGRLFGDVHLEEHGLRRDAGLDLQLVGTQEDAHEQRAHPLLGEQVHPGLVLYRDPQSAGPGATDDTGEGQAVFPRRPAGPLVGVHEAGCPLAFQVEAFARSSRSCVVRPRSRPPPRAVVYARRLCCTGGEVQRLARAQDWPDVLLVHAWSDLVGDEHKAHVRPLGGLPYRRGGEAVLLGLLPALVADAAHRHVL